MESFFRYISYMDYYKNKERIKNAGFLRWKLRNGEHQIEFQIKDVPCMQGTYEIKEKNTGKVLDTIEIDKGIGNYKKEFPSMSASGEEYIDISNNRLYLSDVEGFLIVLNSNEYLSVDVKLHKKEKERNFDREKKDSIILQEKQENLIQKQEQNESIAGNSEIKESKAASENVLINGIEEKYIDPITERNIKIIEPIHDDKWQQLCKKYPNIHPFPNSKVFLSIKPEDFIILQKEYQKLVQNSFLLHGFYNYGHIILGKLSEEEETPIYVGVPGIYYEQEKKAAQMFGFVGFESVEHPVQQGSYGYYMIEVEI